MRYSVFALLLVGFTASSLAALVETVWMSPNNTAKEYLDITYPTVGTWTKLDNGVGGRIQSCAVLDSRRILWIIFGTQNDLNLIDVWSYNFTSDEYRLTYKGSSSTRVYGTQGIPNPAVNPGPLTSHMCTIDSKDTIYIYSSGVPDASSFWSYNTATWQFTWLYGNDSTLAPENNVWPGAKRAGCMVVDADDNVWVVSGTNGEGYAPTAWRYMTASNTWIREYYVSDDTVVPTFDGTPAYGSRTFPSCTIDTSGKIWLFGGQGPVEGGNLGDFSTIWNDLWTFDTKNLASPWQVQFGNSTSYNTDGSLINQFEFLPGNAPASRINAGNLVDRRDGTIMLYGGQGYYQSTFGAKEDFWLFNVTSKQWALASGGIELNDLSVTETRFSSEGNYAGARYYHAIASGLSLGGDMIFVGGQTDSFCCYKDIWIVPQDQCALGSSNCSPNAECIDSLFGFDCICKTGYVGDGITCTEPSPQSPSTPSAASPSQQQQPQSQQAPQQTPQQTPVRKTSAGSALVASTAVLSVGLLLF